VTYYCDQGSLDQFIGSPNFVSEMKQKCMLEIALGIQDLHTNVKNEIAHRDIKPENIFVHEYTIKIGDFGLSKAIEESRTKTNCGTLFYKA
jgi:serine/threonine protein kinase